MDTETFARIAALEAELAKLRLEVAERPVAASSDQVGLDQVGPVTRRRLLRGGGLAAAGAAGVLAGSSNQPAAAQAVDADDVAFSPAGDISAANVQDALEEVDAEKAALSGAVFTGTTTFLSAAQFFSKPWVDITAHGAKGDGTTDDTSAIKTAINWAAAEGGTVLIPPGRYLFSDPITVPAGVDIWGAGGHKQAAQDSGPVLEAVTSDAQLSIQGQGGLSGNFIVRGGNIAAPTRGLVNIDAVERQFSVLRVTHSATDGIIVDNSQNCTFTQLLVAHCDRDGLVLDRGAGNNSFLRCEFTNHRRNNIRFKMTEVRGLSRFQRTTSSGTV